MSFKKGDRVTFRGKMKLRGTIYKVINDEEGFVQWDDIHRVDFEKRCSSPVGARRAAEWLSDLQPLPVVERLGELA